MTAVLCCLCSSCRGEITYPTVASYLAAHPEVNPDHNVVTFPDGSQLHRQAGRVWTQPTLWEEG